MNWAEQKRKIRGLKNASNYIIKFFRLSEQKKREKNIEKGN